MLLRDDEGQASEGSKVRLRSGRVLETRTRSFSNSSAARRSTFLYLGRKEGESVEEGGKNRFRDKAPSVWCCAQCWSLPNCPKLNHQFPPQTPNLQHLSSKCSPTTLLYLTPLILNATAFITHLVSWLAILLLSYLAKHSAITSPNMQPRGVFENKSRC